MLRGNLFLQSALAVLSLLSVAAACLHSCCPRDPVRCTGQGDPHYKTFDGLMYDFQGDCEYVLARPCAVSRDAIDWSVFGRNVPCGTGYTCTDMITVNVYGKQFFLRQSNEIEIRPDGVATLPYCYEKRVSVTVGTHGMLILKTDFGLTVTFGGSSFEIELPKGDYMGNTCGLCGLLNDSPDDDFLLPDGSITSDVDAFGYSWKTDSRCEGRRKRQADKGAADRISHEQARQMTEARLMKGVLGECNELVDPTEYMKAAITDLTATRDKKQICSTLGQYARECRHKGLVLDWRGDDWCGMRCPEGMIYKVDGPTFVPTCQDPKGDAECCNPPTEGCFCPDGLVLNEGKCVDPKECGCDWDGRRLTIGETWMQDDCRRQCTCLPSGKVECNEMRCCKGAHCVTQYNHLQLCMCDRGTRGDGINFCERI